MSDTPIPALVQYRWRNPRQVPVHLLTVLPDGSPKKFNAKVVPGIELIAKTRDVSVDLGLLCGQLEAGDLVLTHASRVDDTDFRGNDDVKKFVYRFHFYPKAIAEVCNDTDQEKLINDLHEINSMGFWRLHVHQNSGEQGPWLSVSCDSRTQRFRAEKPEEPILVRTDGGGHDTPKDGRTYARLSAKRRLDFLGGNRFELAVA